MKAAAEILQAAQRVLVITGAGLSADSGLPTYRGVGGLYEDAEVEDGLTIEEVLSGRMFSRRPELTWRYIAQLEKACRSKQHNRGHSVLAELEPDFERFCVLTQNVDGFHRDAGSKDVIEVHGEIRRLICTKCPYARSVPNYAGLEIPPRCPDCSGMVRPDVVLFGETLDASRIAALYGLLQSGVDAIFSIGTSALFPYIVEPIFRAKAEGIPTVEINPGETELSRLVDVKISERAAVALDEILNAYCG